MFLEKSVDQGTSKNVQSLDLMIDVGATRAFSLLRIA